MIRETFRVKAVRTFPTEGAVEPGEAHLTPKISALLDQADELYRKALETAPAGHIELVLLLAHTELDRAEAERLAASLNLDITSPGPSKPVVVRRGQRYYCLWVERLCG